MADLDHSERQQLPPTTEAILESFRYEPLNKASREIRVLRVARTLSKVGLIQCKLRHVSLTPGEERKDNYTCLSYTWGKPGREQFILVNGQTFKVRENLFAFLCRYRKRSLLTETSRSLWIDAISINQDDASEKGHQVPLMRIIYRKAHNVIIWLGEGDTQADLFLWLGRPELDNYLYFKLILLLNRWRRSPRRVGPAQFGAPNLRLMFDNPHFSEWLWKNSYFFNLNYWNRAWILPEIMLSGRKQIWHGSNRMRWECLQFIVRDKTKISANSGHTPLLKLLSVSKAPEFFAAIFDYGQSECELFVDRIYALIGLSRSLEDFPVDYKDGTALELMLQTVSFYIRHMQQGGYSYVHMDEIRTVTWKLSQSLSIESEPIPYMPSIKVESALRLSRVFDIRLEFCRREQERVYDARQDFAFIIGDDRYGDLLSAECQRSGLPRNAEMLTDISYLYARWTKPKDVVLIGFAGNEVVLIARPISGGNNAYSIVARFFHEYGSDPGIASYRILAEVYLQMPESRVLIQDPGEKTSQLGLDSRVCAG